jgi:hypothetical protein
MIEYNGTVICDVLPSAYDRPVYNAPISGINLTGLSFTTKTITVNITSNGSTPIPGAIIPLRGIPDASAFAGAAPYHMMYISPDFETFQTSWTVPVFTTAPAQMYFVVVTTDGHYYVTPNLSDTSSAVTLDLSAMWPVIM